MITRDDECIGGGGGTGGGGSPSKKTFTRSVLGNRTIAYASQRLPFLAKSVAELDLCLV